MLHKCHANVLKSDASIVTHYALLRKAVGRSCRAAKQPPLRVGLDARSAGIKKWCSSDALTNHHFFMPACAQLCCPHRKGVDSPLPLVGGSKVAHTLPAHLCPPGLTRPLRGLAPVG